MPGSKLLLKISETVRFAEAKVAWASASYGEWVKIVLSPEQSLNLLLNNRILVSFLSFH